MSQPPGDRLVGAALVVLAVAAGLEALTFRVEFLTDPVGPRAIPLLAAGLLAAAGIAILRRPAAGGEWRGAAPWRGLALAVLSLLAYAVLLAPLGFLLATTLEVAFLSRLFGGRPWRSLLAAVGFTVALYVLFVYGLALSLPAGRLFAALGA